MKHLLFIMLLTIPTLLIAQQKIKVYDIPAANGFKIYADNDELCPVSIQLKFVLTNLKSTEVNNNTYVLPAKSKSCFLTDLNVITSNRSYKYSSTFNVCYGDYTKVAYDNNFEYFLPYQKGNSFVVCQGNNGTFSHQKKNAIDFSMPEGTEIYATRGGKVIKVTEDNNRGCPQKECAKYNNNILIYHSDGTVAEYIHIKKNGSVVAEGDSVVIGQLIGYSGDVGWSAGPHLHFEVRIPKITEPNTVATKFLTGNGKQSEILVVKKEYKRDY